MKKALLYAWVSLAGCLSLLAQKPVSPPVKLGFQDSVRVILENTRSVDAEAVAGGFATVWSKLGLDQQQIIKKQARLMKQKGYKVRPQFVDYYGAIANAIARENADVATLTGYLTVAGQVIENENLTNAGIFFNNARQFFEYHALHIDRSYKLHAFDDEYHFDYVKVEVMPSLLDNFDSAPLDNFDNNQNDNFDQNQFDQWDNQDTQEDFSWDDVKVDTVMPPAMPIWMQPTPQPILTGPLIR
ncbi:MAG TPA: hypothetical protein VIS49_12630, partial [Cyclobacteriaceae bacterium]